MSCYCGNCDKCGYRRYPTPKPERCVRCGFDHVGYSSSTTGYDPCIKLMGQRIRELEDMITHVNAWFKRGAHERLTDVGE